MNNEGPYLDVLLKRWSPEKLLSTVRTNRGGLTGVPNLVPLHRQLLVEAPVNQNSIFFTAAWAQLPSKLDERRVRNGSCLMPCALQTAREPTKRCYRASTILREQVRLQLGRSMHKYTVSVNFITLK
jgi:hypothetical protein